MTAVLRPGDQHTRLLKAALQRGEAARAAWTAWQREGDFDRLDAASYRLLPQLFVNLTGAGPENDRDSSTGTTSPEVVIACLPTLRVRGLPGLSYH